MRSYYYYRQQIAVDEFAQRGYWRNILSPRLITPDSCPSCCDTPGQDIAPSSRRLPIARLPNFLFRLLLLRHSIQYTQLTYIYLYLLSMP